MLCGVYDRSENVASRLAAESKPDKPSKSPIAWLHDDGLDESPDMPDVFSS